MMTPRENLLSLYHRTGYEQAPVYVDLCPYLVKIFEETTGATNYLSYFGCPYRHVFIAPNTPADLELVLPLYGDTLHPQAYIDLWGVAHEPGSAAAFHMTYKRHPLENADSLEQIENYPIPDFSRIDIPMLTAQVQAIHAEGLASVGSLTQTIWETAWAIRGMEPLMMDMMTDDPMGSCILDRVTDTACLRAQAYASAGVDILYVGDDVGMQKTLMMSQSLYQEQLKPRMKQVIDAARAIRPDILVMYHSCGYIEPLIPDLIDIGIDILNPVQPECMPFERIYKTYGDVLSFDGTIGTQSTMPYGTPEDVKREVHRNLDLVGERGGLFCCPTHLLEPDVPWENVLAYVEACQNYCK